MALETGDFIANLISDNPTPDDSTHEGDDHLRLIKNVLKKTFPGDDDAGWDGPLTAPLDFLNGLDTTGIPGLITRTGTDPNEIVSIGATTDAGTDIFTAGPNSLVQNWIDGEENPVAATVLNSENFIPDFLLNLIFPVGHIMHCTHENDPNVTYPGTTWLKVEGIFLVGSGSHTDINGETVTFDMDTSGGSFRHTLDFTEMPDHAHRDDNVHFNKALQGGGSDNVPSDTGKTLPWTGDPAQRNTGSVFLNGITIGQPHNNTPPYGVVHIWHRTA